MSIAGAVVLAAALLPALAAVPVGAPAAATSVAGAAERPPGAIVGASRWLGHGELAVVAGHGLHLLEDNGLARMVPGPGAPAAPAWSPDGTWVAFLRTPPGAGLGSPSPALWVARADGSDTHDLSPTGEAVTQFAWRPGTGPPVLAFSATTGPQYISRIFTRSPQAAPSSPLGTYRGLIDFSWAPSGADLAISFRTGSYGTGSPGGFRGELEIAPADGQRGRTVASLPDGGYFELASWWPDGKGLVLWSDPVGSASIAADGLALDSLDLATGRLRALATTLVHDDWLAWSPSGRLLAIVAGGNRVLWDSGKRVEVCTVAPASCRPVPVPPGPLMSLGPAWTDDGDLIFTVAPGNSSADAGFPPGLPPTGGGPWASGNVALWYNAQRLFSVAAGGRASVPVPGTGTGAHTPVATSHGLLYISRDDLWYRQDGAAGAFRIATGLDDLAMYGSNYYGYIPWSQDYAWHA